MEKIILKTHPTSEVFCGRGAINKLKENVFPGNSFLLTDSNVFTLYRRFIEENFFGVPYFILDAGEVNKTFFNLGEILNKMLVSGLHRNSCLFALGGGVIGDMGGLAASLYMRGISYIQIPTTILAQVDSSVGGKTAVDFGKFKNAVGTFYQPVEVIADPMFFDTLPMREIRCGLGEIIKYGALSGDIFSSLYKNKNALFSLGFIEGIIHSCIAYKKSIVEADERECGLRKCLNMGHTTAHALELYYGNMSHGEFVLIGIYLETLLAEEMGLCDVKYTSELKELILRAIKEFPVLKNISMAAELTKMDKKNKSSYEISLIVPVAEGEWKEITVSYRDYCAFLKSKEGLFS